MSAASRTNALTIALPLAPWRRMWCWLVLRLLGLLVRSSSLVRLRFVHAAGWIIVGHLPSDDGTGFRPRPAMIFLSDHDGDLAEYVAAFGVVLTWSMNRAFGCYEGYPGARPTRPFVDFVERGRTRELVRYAAYREVTLTDLEQAVAVADRIAELQRLPDTADDDAFAAAYQRLLDVLALAPPPVVPSLPRGLWAALRSRSTDPGLTVLVPLGEGRTPDAAAALGELAGRSEALLESLGGVHFARAAIVPRVGRGPASAPPVRDHVLFNAWFDGDRAAFVRRLSAQLDETALDALWGCCVGYPGADDVGVLADWILRHRLRFTMAVDTRDGRSVAEMRRLVDRRERALDFVTRGQGEPLSEIRRQIPTLWSGEA